MSKKIEIPKDVFAEVYERNNGHLISICKELNLSNNVIIRHVRLYYPEREMQGDINKKIEREINKEFLIEEYINKKRSIKDIAKEKLVTGTCIRYKLKQFGINMREKDRRIIHDLTGKTIGLLTVISFDHYDEKSRTYWLCKCECGKEKVVSSKYLSVGNINSCGCLRETNHGEYTNEWFKSQKLLFEPVVWRSLVLSAKNRNLTVEIDPIYINELFIKQDGRCALTNLPIVISNDRYSTPNTGSIDRIDSSRGYVKGNLQWIHKDVNRMKLDYNEEYFIEICKLVAQNAIK